MDEDSSNSWIRRAKFSHTVCHRLNYSSSGFGSFSIQPRAQHSSSSLKSRPEVAFASNKAQQKPIMNKQRSLSPLPQTSLSETFKEARHEQKRFSTPGPRRKEQNKDKRIMGKLLNKDSHVFNSKSNHSSPITTKSPYSSPIRHLASMKLSDKSKQHRKDLGWTKYFDHGGGKVTAVETAEEWNVDLSKLFVGVRFAHGAHSRLYHGMYKDEAVAVKIITVPDDDENGMLADRLEKQFIREVSLLSRLHHQNVIKVI